MSYSNPLPFFVSIFLLFIIVQFRVPPSKTFTYINQGPFGKYPVEHSANYRELNIVTFPFTLCFYKTTPNAYILGLWMGHQRSGSITRWVWDANGAKPVHKKATLSFEADGNLVLRDFDGTLAWQTGTRNKGVVGLNLLPNGNLVLYDMYGKYMWQSFDYPTDTFLAGQALRASGPTKITSRLPNTNLLNGVYTYGMEQRFLFTSYKNKNSANPLFYYKSNDYGNRRGNLAKLNFSCVPEFASHAYYLEYKYDMMNSPSSATTTSSRPKYNSTYSMLRVDMDGNVRIYTYDEHVIWGAWEVTYKLFDRDMDNKHMRECRLLKKCGSFGV